MSCWLEVLPGLSGRRRRKTKNLAKREFFLEFLLRFCMLFVVSSVVGRLVVVVCRMF